ncbi:MAG TPA: MFS transporter [Rhabdochlamydiaceae bacterium]|nr:MFS transporter [Rhabdochlamydiaceae bacterium]
MHRFHFPGINYSKKERRSVILAVTIGNFLEWYEIYLYVYWAPIIAKLFFDHSNSELVNSTNAFLLFALGFLARPLGGLYFGRLGDRIGRKKALVLSILMMIFPTFMTGLLPTYAQIGVFASIILGFMRVLQAFPAGGELPGAICYLYESSKLPNRRYISSYASLGYQLGIIVSTAECYFLEKYLSPEALISWGWRLSFIVGGLLGCFGFYLRYKLHETPLFKEMETHEKVVKESIPQVLNKYKKGIFLGILFCALNSASFYLLTVHFPVYFGKILGVNYVDNLLITLGLLVLITVPLPFFGMAADKFNNKAMLLGCTVGAMFLLLPLYYAVHSSSIIFFTLIMVIFSLLFTCVSALLPYVLAYLFPTHVRFTCVGVSFNLADAIIGGFTPALVLFLLQRTGDQGSFCWYLVPFALLSTLGFFFMKEGKKADEAS